MRFQLITVIMSKDLIVIFFKLKDYFSSNRSHKDFMEPAPEMRYNDLPTFNYWIFRSYLGDYVLRLFHDKQT